MWFRKKRNASRLRNRRHRQKLNLFLAVGPPLVDGAVVLPEFADGGTTETTARLRLGLRVCEFFFFIASSSSCCRDNRKKHQHPWECCPPNPRSFTLWSQWAISLEKTNGIGPTNSPISRLSPLWQHPPLRLLSSIAVSSKCLGDLAENHSISPTLFSLLLEKSGFVLFLSGFDLCTTEKKQMFICESATRRRFKIGFF